MTIWNRFEQSISTGLNAGLATWRSGEQLPFYDTGAAWDEWTHRLRRYQQYELYYYNAQYEDLNLLAKALKESGRLYINTRGIYNPIYRLTNLYADKVYPGPLDLVNLESGAMPVVASDNMRSALIQLFRWSNWNTEKQLFVRTGEKLTDSFIRIVDDTDSRRVVLEVVPPQKVRYLRKDAAGNIKEIWFEYYEGRSDEEIRPDRPYIDRQVRVTEVVTTEYITTYEDSKQVDKRDNPYGFVPAVHAKAMDEGFMFGSPRWIGSKNKIDEINSQAALLNDQVRKAVIPYIATIGGQLKTDALRRSGKTMDEIINIAVGVGGDVKAIAPNIDIASALNNIQSQLDELREDNPELFLYQLTDMTVPPSGVALRQFFDLAVNKISGAQSVYDDALIRACQMACTIAGVQDYDGFPFDFDSFERGELDFSIRQRDVIYDAIPETIRINYLLATGAPRSVIWSALGVRKEDQEEWQRLIDEGDTVTATNTPNEADILEANSGELPTPPVQMP